MSATVTPINKETASEFGKLGNKIRWEAYRAQKLAEEQAKLNPPPEVIPQPIADDSFRMAMTKRVRGQIETLQSKLDDELEKAILDSRVLRDLTDAISKLEAVEQRLSNRPLPGSLRPNSKPQKRLNSSAPPEPGE